MATRERNPFRQGSQENINRQNDEDLEELEEGNYVSAEQLRKEAEEIEKFGEVDGKDPVRVAAGKRAAATRKDRHSFPRPEDDKPISSGGHRDTSKEDLTRKK